MGSTVDLAQFAAAFVELALSRKYSEWPEVKDLPAQEKATLLATVAAAGFEPKEVVLGMLKGNYRDQDGSRTGETFFINCICPFKVIGQDGQDDYFATGWLDCALRFVLEKSGEERNEEIYRAIQNEIGCSIPLDPIQLTAEGDFLCEYPRGTTCIDRFRFFIRHERDSDIPGSCAGMHKYCRGFVDRMPATATHDALVCRKCFLRVTFPKEVKTYGELRQALAAKLAQAPVSASV